MPLTATDSTLSVPVRSTVSCSDSLKQGFQGSSAPLPENLGIPKLEPDNPGLARGPGLQESSVEPWIEKQGVPAETGDDGQADDDYPEGGMKAWSIVIGSWCAMFACFSFMNTGGVYQAYISTHQLAGYSESTIGWIFSVYIFLAFFCGLQIGPFFDAKGPFFLVSSGSICLLLGVFTLAESTKIWHFFITYSLLCGLGTSLLFTPSIACIAHWFNRRRGLATGLGCTAGSIGGTLFALVLPRLSDAVGYAWATRILGLVFAVFLVVANLLMRSRLPPKASPALGDFLPDFRIIFAGRGELFFCTVGIFMIEWGLFVPLTYVSTWALHAGVGGPMFGYQLLAVINASSFFGRWIPGFVADRIGPFNTIILACASCLVGLVGFWLPVSILRGFGTSSTEFTSITGSSTAAISNAASVALVVVFAVLFGFGSGSGISLTPVCVGRLCRVRDYGRYYATCYTVVSLGCLTGVPIAGALIQAAGGHYAGLIAFAAACYVLGIAAFCVARVQLVGWRLTAAC